MIIQDKKAVHTDMIFNKKKKTEYLVVPGKRAALSSTSPEKTKLTDKFLSGLVKKSNFVGNY